MIISSSRRSVIIITMPRHGASPRTLLPRPHAKHRASMSTSAMKKPANEVTQVARVPARLIRKRHFPSFPLPQPSFTPLSFLASFLLTFLPSPSQASFLLPPSLRLHPKKRGKDERQTSKKQSKSGENSVPSGDLPLVIEGGSLGLK